MRHLLITLLIGLMSFGLAVEHADAKRFGGGKSFGSYSRSASPSSSQATTPPRQAQQGTRAAGGGMSRFMGPLAGIMAGGLIASLLFGGAFDGIRFMDILLIALLGFIAWKVLAARRRASNTGAHDVHHDQRQQHHQQRQTHDFGPASGAAAPGAGAAGAAMGSEPSWFNREQFLSGAKEHFMNLQRAWDNNDFEKIQEFVTPELYNLLRKERAEQSANNQTEVVRLFAELGDVREYGQQAEATVLFHGIMKEDGQDNEFNETWHLTREVRDQSPWYIQGIEQNNV
ncbi:Predicted lipid-binding transport protein, Tim44 family [Kushneria avicenniae]|uniref:Predicted lipid-binding transport protein, Tim44 family n=1 Tax=Kushneria avicenniae TaxID=402385 RepID=A0A1I1HPP6_9GAMM|nr:TIM44-like domain-containing protein [Kushneria avicenniae]SFC25826.1 Predicted lipid-binding transport protein, Tim44 family [Kushneria avicenniae]